MSATRLRGPERPAAPRQDLVTRPRKDRTDLRESRRTSAAQEARRPGEIEILDEGPRPTDGAGGGKNGRPSIHGHTSGSGIRRSGDR